MMSKNAISRGGDMSESKISKPYWLITIVVRVPVAKLKEIADLQAEFISHPSLQLISFELERVD
jgi:hypothetical protein